MVGIDYEDSLQGPETPPQSESNESEPNMNGAVSRHKKRHLRAEVLIQNPRRVDLLAVERPRETFIQIPSRRGLA